MASGRGFGQSYLDNQLSLPRVSQDYSVTSNGNSSQTGLSKMKQSPKLGGEDVLAHKQKKSGCRQGWIQELTAEGAKCSHFCSPW